MNNIFNIPLWFNVSDKKKFDIKELQIEHKTVGSLESKKFDFFIKHVETHFQIYRNQDGWSAIHNKTESFYSQKI